MSRVAGSTHSTELLVDVVAGIFLHFADDRGDNAVGVGGVRVIHVVDASHAVIRREVAHQVGGLLWKTPEAGN